MTKRPSEPTIIKDCPECGSGFTVMGRGYFKCTDCGYRDDDWCRG